LIDFDLTLYRRIPKDYEGNLRYRSRMLTESASDPGLQSELWQACSRDLLFYINAFVWTFNPRRKKNRTIPFITYDYQDEAFLAINAVFGDEDVLIEKSRDMGASWMCLILMHWKWLFDQDMSFLLVSWKERLVDGAGDSLFAHLDFIHKHLPSWMIPDGYNPKYDRIKLKYVNRDRNNRFDGESTTANVGRGGRRTGILVDEFGEFENGGWPILSATADNTDMRIFNSTPSGTGNAFYAQRQKGTARMRFHWSRHPEKGAGLYRPDGNGEVEFLDKDFEFPAGYEFVHEIPEGIEGLRSPWYDRECRRRAGKVEIATQLDIDYQGSDYPYFDPTLLRGLRMEYCRPPDHSGVIQLGADNEPIFSEESGGPLKLWCDLDEDWTPLDDRDYICGVDVSHGTGASSSCLSVVDRLSGEKVAEWAHSRTPIHEFAEIAVALCNMFRGGRRPAFMIWEATGLGINFGQRVMDHHGFTNVYYHTDDKSITRKRTNRPGWWSSGEGKKVLLTHYRTLLFDKTFINPSDEALDEASEYVHMMNGSIEHSGSSNSVDPTNRGKGHGDRVIADALAAKLLRERKRPKKQERTEEVPVGSFLWRRQEHQRETAEKLVWD
jgi:hypothetical protein